MESVLQCLRLPQPCGGVPPTVIHIQLAFIMTSTCRSSTVKFSASTVGSHQIFAPSTKFVFFRGLKKFPTKAHFVVSRIKATRGWTSIRDQCTYVRTSR